MHGSQRYSVKNDLPGCHPLWGNIPSTNESALIIATSSPTSANRQCRLHETGFGVCHVVDASAGHFLETAKLVVKEVTTEKGKIVVPTIPRLPHNHCLKELEQ